MTTKKTPESRSASPAGEFLTVRIRLLRHIGDQDAQPDTPDDGGNWMLKFAPSDGQSVRVRPDEKVYLQTGVSVDVPKGYEARLSYLFAHGRPSQWVPCMELQGSSDQEVVAPFRNETAQIRTLRPGDLLFRLVLVEPTRAYLIPGD